MGTVLVVDDDPFLTKLVAEVLGGAGHRVVTTNRSSEALPMACDAEVDLAILDIMMPGQSGFEVLRQLRADPGLARLPVLFLSSLHGAKDRVHGLREGADDYLGKPFDIDELVVRVERLLERSNPRNGEVQPLEPHGDGSLPQLGRYEVREVLGRGAMGTVFRGWDPRLRRWVALKTIRVDEPELELRHIDPLPALLEEAVHVAQINHPNVVTVYDASSTGSAPFIAMEYVEGLSLSTLLRRCRNLSVAASTAIARAIARGLAAAHDKGIVHRDVKPANVLLGFDGAIKLTDFGLAGALSSLASRNGMVYGTPGYIPPEVLRNQPIDGRSDLFGLGVILYRCLTSWEPFRGLTVDEIVNSTLSTDPPRPHRLAPDIPDDLSSLVMDLVEQRPGQRPRDAAAVLRRLDETIDEPWDASLVLDHRNDPEGNGDHERHSQTLTIVSDLEELGAR